MRALSRSSYTMFENGWFDQFNPYGLTSRAYMFDACMACMCDAKDRMSMLREDLPLEVRASIIIRVKQSIHMLRMLCSRTGVECVINEHIFVARRPSDSNMTSWNFAVRYLAPPAFEGKDRLY